MSRLSISIDIRELAMILGAMMVALGFALAIASDAYADSSTPGQSRTHVAAEKK